MLKSITGKSETRFNHLFSSVRELSVCLPLATFFAVLQMFSRRNNDSQSDVSGQTTTAAYVRWEISVKRRECLFAFACLFVLKVIDVFTKELNVFTEDLKTLNNNRVHNIFHFGKASSETRQKKDLVNFER